MPRIMFDFNVNAFVMLNNYFIMCSCSTLMLLCAVIFIALSAADIYGLFHKPGQTVYSYMNAI